MARDTQQYGCLIGLICVLKYDGLFLHPNKYEIPWGGGNPRIKADEEVGTRSRLHCQKAGREERTFKWTETVSTNGRGWLLLPPNSFVGFDSQVLK